MEKSKVISSLEYQKLATELQEIVCKFYAVTTTKDYRLFTAFETKRISEINDILRDYKVVD